MNLIVSPEAIVDLSEIYDYISLGSPAAADRVLDVLYSAFQRLADGELQGPRARLLDGRRVQSWPEPPYRIYYQRTATHTRIVRVYHQARRPIEQ
jgi:toxin ParE1/3/4